ncbi:glycosyltransferase family 4 protein [Persephonella sp. KM09-Lau-8]|uniref:glycosyltransferase family 4 protein n=1 Tax=Persephonella sp. KM09-Lau-8 TaxID=1158345 RepID=UPI00049813A4|nr:glycosyltransferase family 4 protein [Persephonella sp. KM09-Lau-8]
MNLLILNRRCIKHSQKGGAEVYTYEIAQSVVEKGGTVEWFSSKEKGLKDEEIIDGIKFIRKGNELTVHFYGFLYALKKGKNWLILDEFNGIGFFTFFKKNSFLLIHQLYEEFWNVEFRKLGNFFKILEKLLLRLYRNKKVITVSESTKKDLLNLGFKNITIIYNGLNVKPIENINKDLKKLRLVYLGRLKKTKNPEDAIKAFFEVKKVIKDTELIIIGKGPLYEYLIRKYKDAPDLIFKGFVSEEKKYDILKNSHFILVPSIREGWGQVVLQANAMGTPAIGYKVAGLIDSIKNGETGYIVGDYREMADKIIELWGNKEKYEKISKNALEWSKNFSWERTRKEFLNFLKNL